MLCNEEKRAQVNNSLAKNALQVAISLMKNTTKNKGKLQIEICAENAENFQQIVIGCKIKERLQFSDLLE